jgi:hypothetical protein
MLSKFNFNFNSKNRFEKNNRFFSTVEMSTPNVTQSGKTEIVEEVTKGPNGVETRLSKTITTVTKTWNNMSRRSKFLVGGYVACGFVTSLFITYNNGTDRLNEFRSKKDANGGSTKNITFKTESDREKNIVDERQAIVFGCREKSWSKFWSSIFWIGYLTSNIMPPIVAALNKPMPTVTVSRSQKD